MEFTIGSIVTKIDAVLSKMDSLDTQNGLQPLKNDDDDDDDDQDDDDQDDDDQDDGKTTNEMTFRLKRQRHSKKDVITY